MSVKVMGAVFDLDIPSNWKLVLLAYADHASHDGENVRPAVKLIVEKTNYSERQIQRVTSELAAAGYLVPRNKRVGGRAKANRWRIPYDERSKTIMPIIPRQIDGVSEGQKGDADDRKGDKPSKKRVTSPPETVTPTSPEPSIEPSIEPSEEPRVSKDQTPLAQAKASLRMEFTNGNIYRPAGPVYDQVFDPLKGAGLMRSEDATTVNLTHPDPSVFDSRTEAMLRQAFVGALGGEVKINIVKYPDD